MVVMALRTDGNQRYNWMKNRRSLFVNWTRPRIFRCSTISCCLNAAFSASSRLLDLKIEPPRLKRKNISVAIAADVKRFYQQTKWTTFSVHTGRPSLLKGRKVAIKYRDRPDNTWAGRGAQPVWLREKLKAGSWKILLFTRSLRPKAIGQKTNKRRNTKR
jgi:hypothetical protein